jgi:hypothetical protein
MIETVLDTRELGIFEVFGNALGVAYKVDGVLYLHVDKVIHLKELSVILLYEGVLRQPHLSFSPSSSCEIFFALFSDCPF